MPRLNTELDNLRTALDWCRMHDEQTGLLLAGCITRFWDIRGHLTEGRRWLNSLLAESPQRTSLRAKALYTSGHLASRQGDNAEGIRLLEESLAIYSEVGDQIGTASALERLGITTALLGNNDLGIAHLERSISLFRRIGYKVGLGWALGSLGMYSRTIGDYSAALDALNESYALTRETGDLHGQAYALNNLGQLARVRGDYDAAWNLLQECLEVSRRMVNKPFICWALECLSTVARMRGDYTEAQVTLQGSLEVSREIGILRHLARCIYSFAVLAVHFGSYLGAVRLYAAALNLHPNIKLSLDADEVAEWDDAFDTARTALSVEAFAQAWAEGEAMTWDQASDYAIESVPSITHPSE